MSFSYEDIFTTFAEISGKEAEICEENFVLILKDNIAAIPNCSKISGMF